MRPVHEAALSGAQDPAVANEPRVDGFGVAPGGFRRPLPAEIRRATPPAG